MSPSRTELRAPWSPRHLPVALVGMAAGAAVILLAWYGASGEKTFADQVPWITVGILGSVVAAGAQVSYIAFGRRSVGRRALRLIAVRPPTSSQAMPAGTAASLVAVEGATWFHRADCLLVDGKSTLPVSDPGDRLACAVCCR